MSGWAGGAGGALRLALISTVANLALATLDPLRSSLCAKPAIAGGVDERLGMHDVPALRVLVLADCRGNAGDPTRRRPEAPVLDTGPGHRRYPSGSASVNTKHRAALSLQITHFYWCTRVAALAGTSGGTADQNDGDVIVRGLD